MLKWLKRLIKWLKRLKYVFWVVLGLAIIIGVLIFLRCECDDTPIIKEGWEPVKTEKTSGPPATWMPWFKPTKADKVLKDWPSGTRIIEVEPQSETVYIAIPESGPIQIPRGVKGITVYEKPVSKAGLEFRPWLGGGATVYPEIKPAAAVGVDILNIWRVHTGPGVCVDSGAFSGLWTASVGMWRNIDARAGGGFGTGGATGFVGVSIGIE